MTNVDELKRLACYEKSRGYHSHKDSLNYSEIGAAIGRTKTACKKKVYKIYGAGVLNQESINDIRSRCLANKISNIPSRMHLANMLTQAVLQERVYCYFTYWILGLSCDTSLSRQDVILQESNSCAVNKVLTLSQDQETFLDSLEGKRCILPDRAMRNP